MLKNLQIWFSVNHLKIEGLLVALVAVSVLLNYVDLNGGPEILLITMSFLSGYYFISYRILPLTDGWLGNVTTRVVSVSSSVAVVGLLFAVLHLNGARQMLAIGSGGLALGCILLVYYQVKSSDNKYLPLIIRVVILGILSAITLRDLPDVPSQRGDQPPKPPISLIRTR